MFCATCGAALSAEDASSGRCDACANTTASQNPYAPIAATAPAIDPYQPRFDAGAQAAFIAEDPGPALSLDVVPQPPRVPSPRARSLVFGYQGKQRAFLTIGLIFMGVGVIFSFIFGQGLGSDFLLGFFGTAAQGTMIESHLQTNVSVNHAHPTLLRFRYKADGETYEGASSTFDRSLGKTPNSPIPIEVLGFSPSISRVTGTTCSATGYAGVFTFIFPILGAIFTFGAVRSNRREIRAFVHGSPVLARVVSRGLDRSVKVNGRSPTKVAWQFEANGQSYTGDISHMNPTALGDLMRGPQVVVLYDPGNPKTNTVWVN